MSRDDVDSWTAEALHTLELAQQISTSAHASMNASSDILTSEVPTKIDASVSKFEQLESKFSQFLDLTKNSQESVTKMVNGHDTKVAQILQPALKELDTVLDTLHRIEVPHFLVKREILDPNTVLHLVDFVALEDINTLQANISIYIQNCQKVNSLLREELGVISSDSTSKSQEFKRLSASFESQILPLMPYVKYAKADAHMVKTATDLVGTILRENNALGSEITSLLEMVTNHYDQCVLASEWRRAHVQGRGAESGESRDLSASEIDLEVLREDTLELPAVLKEIRAIYDIISHNEKRASAFAKSKLADISAFTSHCSALCAWCAEYEATDITRLLILLVECQDIYDKCSLDTDENDADEIGEIGENSAPQNSSVERYTTALRQLCDHYRQFSAVYQAQYLSELHYEQYVYPRKFLKTLDDYLNGELLQLEDEESARRREWLKKYGDFIPSEFRLPGETGQPRVVQVISEGLDHLEDGEAEQDEDRIVGMLRGVKIRER